MSIESLYACQQAPGKWSWQFVSAAGKESFLKILPEISEADLIRNVDKREVYHKKGIFVKFYMPAKDTFSKNARALFFPSAANEFNRLRMLQKMGIPAVTPLAYGKYGTRSVLITKEEPAVCSVAELFKEKYDSGTKLSDQFFSNWGKFVQKILTCKLYFADFHTGNLLYSTVKDDFVLVDPEGIKKTCYLRKIRILRMLKRQLALPLEFYSKREVLLFLSETTPASAEKMYYDILEYSSRYVRELQLPKRIKSFRKHKLIIDGIQRKETLLGIYPLENTVTKKLSAERADAVWERDYICSLHCLPLLHTVARVPGSGKIYLQTPGESAVDPQKCEELLERLRICDLSADDFDFCTDRHGRTLLIDKAVL